MNTLRHASALELSIKRELILVSLLGAVLMSACSPRAARREVPHFENPYSEARDLLTDAGRTYTKVGDTMQSILDKPPSEQEKIDQLMGSWVVFSLRDAAKRIATLNTKFLPAGGGQVTLTADEHLTLTSAAEEIVKLADDLVRNSKTQPIMPPATMQPLEDAAQKVRRAHDLVRTALIRGE
jgi:hypothetical protein